MAKPGEPAEAFYTTNESVENRCVACHVLSRDGERMYVGTIPGGLFESRDGGESFALNRPLWDHESRGGDVSTSAGTGVTHWFGTPASEGEFAAGIHSIIVDPRDGDRIMATFIWRRFRPSSALGARLQFAFHGFTLLWASVAWIPLVAALVAAPALGAAALAAGFALGGLAPALVYVLIRNDRRRALWAFVYAPYSVFALGWIKPYALATARRNGWLTRGAATAPRATVASNAREMGALRAS